MFLSCDRHGFKGHAFSAWLCLQCPHPLADISCEAPRPSPLHSPPRMVVALLSPELSLTPSPSEMGLPFPTLRDSGTGRRPAAGGSPASVRPSTRPRGAWGSPWPRRAARRGCGLSGSGWRGWGRWQEALGREQCQETVCGTGGEGGRPGTPTTSTHPRKQGRGSGRKSSWGTPTGTKVWVTGLCSPQRLATPNYLSWKGSPGCHSPHQPGPGQGPAHGLHQGGGSEWEGRPERPVQQF